MDAEGGVRRRREPLFDAAGVRVYGAAAVAPVFKPQRRPPKALNPKADVAEAPGGGEDDLVFATAEPASKVPPPPEF
jgi:hypothetical protein